MKLYPNPVKDILNFSEEISNSKITDISGRTVKQIFSLAKAINLENLAKGTYISTGTTKVCKVINQKFIKN